jgi:site-specific recombinase XerD
MNIKFSLKHPNKTESSLYIQVRVNGNKYNFFPGKVIQTKHWSKSKQLVLSGQKHYQEINSYLSGYADNLEKIILKLQTEAKRINKSIIQANIDQIYKTETIVINKGEIIDFISFMDTYIRNQTDKAYTTIQVLKQTRKFVIMAFDLIPKKELEAFEKLSPKAKSVVDLTPNKLLDFDRINIQFLENFQSFMFQHKFKIKRGCKEEYLNYKKNYIAKQIKMLKQFINAAIEKCYVENFVFRSVKALTEDIDSVFTDLNELQKFLGLSLEEESLLEKTRDAYVINCFLGLRFSDLSKTKPNLFSRQTINGKLEIVFKGRALKTDKKVEFVVHPTAVKLLKKYNFQLPVLSENSYNESLKILALRAGLTGLETIRETRGTEKIFKEVPKYSLISSHTGRRSFCTNMFMAGVPIQAIMSVSGHVTEKEFLKYINKSATVSINIVAQQVHTIKQLSVF